MSTLVGGAVPIDRQASAVGASERISHKLYDAFEHKARVLNSSCDCTAAPNISILASWYDIASVFVAASLLCTKPSKIPRRPCLFLSQQTLPPRNPPVNFAGRPRTLARRARGWRSFSAAVAAATKGTRQVLRRAEALVYIGWLVSLPLIFLCRLISMIFLLNASKLAPILHGDIPLP